MRYLNDYLIRGLSALVLLGGLGTWLQAGLEIDVDDDKDTPRINVPQPAGGAITAKRPAKLLTKGPLDELLRFKNEDTLHGNLVSIDEKSGLTWIRPDLNGPIITKLTHIRGVKLFRQPAAQPSGARVQLSNDDVIYGALVSMDKEELVLDTWFAGQLKIPVVMLKTIQPATTGGALLFSGPGKLSDWGYKNGSWQLKGGKLVCQSGQLGRQLKLPDRIHIKLDASWTGTYPSFSIISHCKEIRRYYRESYNLQFSSNSIYLYRGNGNENFGQLNYSQLRRMKNVRIDLFVDKKDKKVALMLNGALVKQWAGLHYAPPGGGFMLVSHGSYGPTTFANLRIMRWDGRVPSSTATAKATKEDLIHFSNGDKMSGKITGIKNGKVHFQTAFAPIPVPIKNVAQIIFSDEEAERARRNAGDVRLYFHNGDRLTMKLIELKQGKIAGKSENFGEKTFDLNTFIGMKFNIYDEAETDSKFEDLLFSD